MKLAVILCFLAFPSHATFYDFNKVSKTGGDSMEGPFTVNGGSVTFDRGLEVSGATTTFRDGIYISSSSTAASYFRIGKQAATNASFVTNSNSSGLLSFMPGKANPQIIMGDATTTGSAFIDASSGRPLLLNELTTGFVQIQNLEMTANGIIQIDTQVRFTGTGAPPANVALCLTGTGAFGHCTGLLGCTCVSP